MSEIVPAPIQAAFDRERITSRDAARLAREPAEHRALTVRMYGRLAQLQNQVIAQEKVAVACQRGCVYCCSQRVEMRPHEVFVLAGFIQARFDPRQRARMQARLDENLARIADLTREQHVQAGISCALLVDGSCSVYEARPAACRKYYSVSVDTCRSAFENPAAPLIGPLEHDNLRFAGNAVALGFAKGISEAGYSTDLFELHQALNLALESNKPEKRYRDGKKPFV